MQTIKQVAFEPIQTAKTIQQFRENLKKYFVTVNDDLMIKHKKQLDFININFIKSINDVYKIREYGSFGSGNSFRLVPLCNIKKEGLNYISDFKKGFDVETRIIEVLNDPTRSTILEVSSNDNLMSDLETMNFAPGWVKTNNPVWRTFFRKTLGKYSGYENDENGLSFYNEVSKTKELKVLS